VWREGGTGENTPGFNTSCPLKKYFIMFYFYLSRFPASNFFTSLLKSLYQTAIRAGFQ
jgi:hypothetical protein